MFLHILLASLAAGQLAGMAWAFRVLLRENCEGPLWWKAFLVIVWPFTLVLNWIGRVQ